MRHQEAIEGGPAYPQKFGGLHFVATALPKGGLDCGRADDPIRQVVQDLFQELQICGKFFQDWVSPG